MNPPFLRILILGSVLLLPSTVMAQDVSSCIKKERAVKPSTKVLAYSLVNACDHPVFVFWCHMGVKDGNCGEKKFFRRGRKMQPGERYFNQYSLPDNFPIHFAACLGSKKNVSLGGVGERRYYCSSGNTPAAQTSGTAEIECGDEKVSYHWRRRHSKNNRTIIEIKTGGVVSNIKIATAEFDHFVANKKASAPPTFRRFLCKDREKNADQTIDAEVLRELKTFFRKKVDEKTNRLKNACQQTLHPESKCAGTIRPNISNGGPGVKG